MCGIVGIVNLSQDKILHPLNARKMLDTMPWRGPDANGVWHDNHVALGHVRLSIIDLSCAANQPMVDQSGRIIVFNGEIYNYRDLRKELSSGFEFRTQSDTEVILKAYSKWGEGCVKRFNGEWAFAIYDPMQKKLFMSRDRFGIKPLYYHFSENTLHFASEVRSLLAAGIPATVSVNKLAHFLKFRRIEQRAETILNWIFPLEPANNLSIDLKSGKFSIFPYYGREDLFSSDIPHDENEAAEAFGVVLQDAVKVRLHADVPVHVLLSGGLDSSAIAALSMGVSEKTINTISYVFPGNANDESYYSDMVASYLCTDHSRVKSENDNFFDIFDQVIIAQDAPTFSEKHVARFLLYRSAAKRAKVVLEGQGGDEVFGGYSALYELFRNKYQDKLGVRLLMDVENKIEKSKLPHFAELHSEVRNKIGRIAKSKDDFDCKDAYLKLQYSIFRNNLLSLLHTGDRLQMYNSIEGRYPFLDHRVVEFGMSLPVKFKMREFDKYLLRVFLDNNKLLPKKLIRRTDKKGFSTDLQDYLLKSPKAEKHFYESYEQGMKLLPGLFDMVNLKRLLIEQYKHGINNNKRLLAIYALMTYLRTSSVSITE